MKALDAATFIAMSAVMLAVALLASYIPAHRASSVDPIQALRMERGCSLPLAPLIVLRTKWEPTAWPSIVLSPSGSSPGMLVSRLVAGLLFGVERTDPITYAAAIAPGTAEPSRGIG